MYECKSLPAIIHIYFKKYLQRDLRYNIHKKKSLPAIIHIQVYFKKNNKFNTIYNTIHSKTFMTIHTFYPFQYITMNVARLCTQQ